MYRYGDYERKISILKRELEQKRFRQGLMLAPILMLGWFPIVWIIAKVFAK